VDRSEREVMGNESIVLPFKLPELWGGLAQAKGMARVTPGQLTLEFVLKDNLLSVLKTKVKEIHIPQPEIDTVRCKRGWFGGKVFIRLKSMKWIAELPGCDSNEIILRVARADRDAANAFVQALTRA
jgi:hypothetical protein